MALKITGPIEAFGNLWGRRTFLRRTLGSPARNKAMTRLMAITIDCGILAKLKDNDALRVPEAATLAQLLGDGYSGEGGHDTQMMLAGIKAATAVRQNEAAKADLNELQ